MKILHYCQHVLGVGHFMRSLAVARALAPHRVVMAAGGPPLEAALPGNLSLARLPGLAMDENFQGLHSSDNRDIEAVKADRVEMLAGLVRDLSPDIFLVELYPFGRKKFRFELSPALELARRAGALNVSSLRDILVERDDKEKFENRVVNELNQRFDLLLVHSDPAVQRIEETFGRTGDIAIPIAYTGYVAETPSHGARDRIRAELGLADDEKLILASAGGGKVGFEGVYAAVAALPRLGSGKVRLMAFTGPFMDADKVARLKAISANDPRITIRKFSDRFLDLMAAADLSVSMAGYNTTMNILATGVPALVLPFDANLEQATRAGTFAARGLLRVIKEKELADLSGPMAEALARPRPAPDSLPDLGGAPNTARILEKAVAERGHG